MRADRSALALAGLLISTAAPAWEPAFRDAASRLAPHMASVTSCSPVRGSDTHRIVVFKKGFEHVSSEVYFQWLEWNEAGPRVSDSVLIEELSSGFWTVDEPVVVSRKDCSMRFIATHTFSSEVVRFVVRPQARGRYFIRRVGKNRVAP